MEAYKQEKFEVMQRARAYGITMMVGTQDECDIAFFDFKKKLDSFEDMTFEAGAASRDAEMAELKQRFYANGFEAGRQAEREECAKVCDKLAYEWRGANSRIVECAAAIRARGDTE